MKRLNFTIYAMVTLWVIYLFMVFIGSDYEMFKESSLTEILMHNWCYKLVFFSSLSVFGIPKIGLLKSLVKSELIKIDNLFFITSAIVSFIFLILVMVLNGIENIFQYSIIGLFTSMSFLVVIQYRCFKEKRDVIKNQYQNGFILY